ncbi:DinB family protein [Maribacter sp. 2307UL18-2]|uniref:DinB family protein n=1 Tax=Maribacter sp. 2307UL18-2 TaxID=3386274 RepID=UPI0039BCCDEB
MTTKDLRPSEFAPYYLRYIEKLPDEIHLRDSFKLGKEAVVSFFNGIPHDKHDYAYDLGKWTCKEVLQHLVDTERIFQYRLFRIARNDKTALAGFDQSIYMEPSMAKSKSMDDLLAEFTAVRNSSIILLNSLGDDELEHIGIADGSKMSARAAAFTIAGHDIWHMEIVMKKYLSC